jgi:hypothetical protein
MRRAKQILLEKQRAAMLKACSKGFRNGLSQAERKERAAKDDFFFFSTYLPHIFDLPAAPFHREICELCDKREGKTIIVVIAPRLFGKTVNLSQAKPLKEICFERRKSIVGVSASKDIVGELVAPIAQELNENALLIEDFGNLIKEGGETSFKTHTNVKYKAIGRGQRARGLHPDLCIIDDIEDDEQARSSRRVKKLDNWFWDVLFPAMMPRSKGGSTTVIAGTLLANKSFLDLQFKNPEIPEENKRFYRALNTDENGNYYSLWEDCHSVADLLDYKKEMGSRRFNKEFQNSPQDEDSVFQPEWILGFLEAEFQAKMMEYQGEKYVQ